MGGRGGRIRPDRLGRLRRLLSGGRWCRPRRLRPLRLLLGGSRRSRPSRLCRRRRGWIRPRRLPTLGRPLLRGRLGFAKPDADFRPRRWWGRGRNLGPGLRFGLCRFRRGGRGCSASIAIVCRLLGRRLVTLVEVWRYTALGSGHTVREHRLALALERLLTVEHIVIEQRRRIELATLGTCSKREREGEQSAEAK